MCHSKLSLIDKFVLKRSASEWQNKMSITVGPLLFLLIERPDEVHLVSYNEQKPVFEEVDFNVGTYNATVGKRHKT